MRVMGQEEFLPCAILSSPAFSQPAFLPLGCPLHQRLPRKTAIAYRAVTGAIQVIAISRLSTSVERQPRALAPCAASIRAMRSHASEAAARGSNKRARSGGLCQAAGFRRKIIEISTA
jgi:hypothetical protein